MNREPHWCPVDGCEFGPGRTVSSVRSHVNAESSSGHTWHQLRGAVEAQELERQRGEECSGGGVSDAGGARVESDTTTSRMEFVFVLAVTVAVVAAVYWATLSTNNLRDGDS